MSTSESYIGQNALISYLTDNDRTTKSYWRFLKNHRDIIIASITTNTSFLDNWNKLDNL
ncbi:9472_t:CDS:2 [Rhizophagus irregularis]|nr:9472_t:CDS:2 [Rhizophagus irregularis]